MNVYDILKERGYIAQTSNEDELRKQLEQERVTIYCGYDPTADSLHVGHFLTLMAMSHLQKAGHQIITLLGGGTATIGDPTGKNDMRKMLSNEDLDNNAQCIKEQISKFLDYTDDKAIMDNNANWLRKLEYLPFLRDIAIHFSVNKMLSAECYKSRLANGLSLLEFNYMILQSYDFLQLFKKYNCTLEVGGDDQWSNMIGGIELIRKKERKKVNVMTFNLLTTSEGKKMGKTEKGALWLNPNKTTPFEFYQYWRNIEDKSVEKCLALLTYLPMEEVRRLGSLEGAEINKAKEILAYEVTKIVHSEEDAKKAQEAARSLFSDANSSNNIPSTTILQSDISPSIDILSLMLKVNLIPSKSEGRRLISQGGIKLNDKKITDLHHEISINDFENNEIMIQKGKKKFLKIILK